MTHALYMLNILCQQTTFSNLLYNFLTPKNSFDSEKNVVASMSAVTCYGNSFIYPFFKESDNFEPKINVQNLRLMNVYH